MPCEELGPGLGSTANGWLGFGFGPSCSTDSAVRVVGGSRVVVADKGRAGRGEEEGWIEGGKKKERKGKEGPGSKGSVRNRWRDGGEDRKEEEYRLSAFLCCSCSSLEARVRKRMPPFLLSIDPIARVRSVGCFRVPVKRSPRWVMMGETLLGASGSRLLIRQ